MITKLQFQEMERRVSPKIKDASESCNGVDRESDLHDEIAAELVRRRFYFVHSRMDCRTTQQKGVVDFIVAAPDGKTYWIEAKRKGAKLRPEQNVTRHVLLSLNHKHSVVHNMQEFEEAIKL